MTQAEDLSFFFDSDADATQDVSAASVDHASAQYLIFSVSKLEMAVALACVSEIVPYERVSVVPRAPEYVRGVVRVRGRVIPVLDLAIKLGMPPEVATKRTCILMLELELAAKRMPVGVVIDGLAKLLDVELALISPAPRFSTGVDVKFVEGLLPTERGMLSLIDLQQVFASDELAEVHSIDGAS